MHNILVRDRVLATMEDGVGIKTRFLPKNIQSLLHRPSVDRFPHCDAMGLIEVIQRVRSLYLNTSRDKRRKVSMTSVTR